MLLKFSWNFGQNTEICLNFSVFPHKNTEICVKFCKNTEISAICYWNEFPQVGSPVLYLLCFHIHFHWSYDIIQNGQLDFLRYHGTSRINSFALGRCGSNFRCVTSRHISFMSMSYEITLRRMSRNPSDGKSTLVQVMACCCHTANHNLSQCWPRSMSPGPNELNHWVPA